MLIVDGSSVRSKRKGKGLNQEDLAEASGVCRSIISRIETGKLAEVRMTTLNSLADSLDVTTDDITRQVTPEKSE